MNKLEDITNHIYPFIIKDWKNTSLLIDKNNNKAFKEVLNGLIYDASQKSELYISKLALEFFENNLLNNNKILNKDLIANIHEQLKKVEYKKKTFNISNFLDQACDYLDSRYSYISTLKPQGWEQFILSSKKESIDVDNYFKKISPLRKNLFTGLSFSDGNLEFYDSISLHYTATAFLEEDMIPYKMLFASIIAYTFKYHEYQNSLVFIDEIKNICKLEKISSVLLKSTFDKYINYDEKKVDFEIIEENKKRKQDLYKILNKLAKV